MEIQYLKSENEIELATECSLRPCALKLDMVAESISVTPVKVEMDDQECTIFDTESGVIYWPIPKIPSSDVNALLNLIAPLAEIIISLCKKNIPHSEIPLELAVEVELVKIYNYVNDHELLQSSFEPISPR